MRSLAQALQDSGQYDRAEALWDALIQAHRKTKGEGHATTLAAQLDRADLDYARGRHAAAESAYRAILDVCLARLGPDHDNTDWAENGLARILDDRGDHAGALPHLRAAVARARKAQSDRPALGERLTWLGQNLLATKAWAEAEAALRESLAIRSEAAPGAWTTFNTRSLLGEALVGQKRYAEAEPLLLAGYDGLKTGARAIPVSAQGQRLREAIDRLIVLGEATGKADQVKAWKAERAKLGAGEPKP